MWFIKLLHFKNHGGEGVILLVGGFLTPPDYFLWSTGRQQCLAEDSFQKNHFNNYNNLWNTRIIYQYYYADNLAYYFALCARRTPSLVYMCARVTVDNSWCVKIYDECEIIALNEHWTHDSVVNLLIAYGTGIFLNRKSSHKPHGGSLSTRLFSANNVLFTIAFWSKNYIEKHTTRIKLYSYRNANIDNKW